MSHSLFALCLLNTMKKINVMKYNMTQSINTQMSLMEPVTREIILSERIAARNS